MPRRDAQKPTRYPRKGRLGGFLGWPGDIKTDSKSGFDWPEGLMVEQCGGWRRRGYQHGTHDYCTPSDDCCAPGDSVALVSVSATDATATEGGDTGTFTLTRTGGPTTALTVSFGLTGSAALTTDYTASATGGVTIAAGATTATVTITALSDAVTEGNETVVLSIIPPPYVSSTTRYNIDPDARTATVTIADGGDPG